MSRDMYFPLSATQDEIALYVLTIGDCVFTRCMGVYPEVGLRLCKRAVASEWHKFSRS